MNLTKEQISSELTKLAGEKNGYQNLMELMLNSLMKIERDVFLDENRELKNKCNGFRGLRVFGSGKSLELKIPRDRLGEFKPMILALYRSH